MRYIYRVKINNFAFPLFFMFAPLAVADEFEAQSGWYGGVRANYSSNENSCLDSRITCDKTDTGYGFFGGYEFNERYGAEISWNDIGDSRAQYMDWDLDGELKQADVSLKISHVLTERLSIYGKVGAAFWDGEVIGGPGKVDDSGVRPLLGVGLQMPFSSRFSGRIEYQYIDKVGNDDMGFSNPNYLGVALVWHFSALARTSSPTPAPEVVVVTEPAPAPVTPPPQQIEERITLDEQLGGPLFEFNKADVRNMAGIEPVVKLLLENPLLTVSVTGHTDARGNENYNQRLSEQRAQVVAEYLRVKGVAANRISVFGEGESRPVADNDTEAGRAKNRRVEFVVRGTKTQP